MVSRYFTYDKGKTIQALRYHFITRREIRMMMILVNVFAIVSAVLFFFHKISPLAFLLSSVLWFALMITFWFLLPSMIFRRTATFRDGFKVVLGDHELIIENERGESRWKWESFSSRMESPHFIHLYFNSRTFFIIPKDAFDHEEMGIVRDIIAKKVPVTG